MPHESFAAALSCGAAAHPERVFCAFSGDGRWLSWREMHQRVARCASALSDAGVGPGVRVALHLHLSPELLIHLLAVIQCGGLAVPVDVAAHPDLVRSMLHVLDPDLIVRQSPEAPDAGLRSPEPATGWCYRPAEHEADETGLARLGVFTSGSTGVPRCVLLSEPNLMAGAGFVAGAHGITAADRALCLMPLHHINGIVTTVLAPLLSGGSVVFFQHTLSARNFLHVLEQWEVTWFSAAPVHYGVLVHGGRKPGEAVRCRFGRSASAPLPAAVQQRFEDQYGIPVIETLGLTECAGQVFSNPMDPVARKPGSVGLPFGNQAEIVDTNRLPLPDGQEGEIRVRGPNVMLGYLGEPESTADVLHQGWLYTGDLGVRDVDGYFRITGRKKLIAIISGINVSLGAVEAMARTVDFVDEAVAIAVPDPAFGEVIEVFYVGRLGADNGIQRIRQAIIPALPHHLALGRIVHLDELPRSASGKILRFRLQR